MARKNKDPEVKEPKQPKAPKKEKTPKKEKAPKQPKAPKKAKEPKNTAVQESRATRIIGNPVRILVIMTAISLLIGAALILVYQSYQNYFDFIVGGIIALIGIVNIVFYFCKKIVDGVFRSEFAIGVFCLAVGAYIALNGGVSFSFLVVIGALCTLDGIIKLQYTLDLARMRYKKWWLILIFAFLGIVIGVVILMDLPNDIFSANGITYTGYAVCINALIDLVAAIVIAVRNHKVLKGTVGGMTPVASVAPAAEEVPAESEEPAEEAAAEMPEAAEEPAEELSEEAGDEAETAVQPETEEAFWSVPETEEAAFEPTEESEEPAFAEESDVTEDAAEEVAEPVEETGEQAPAEEAEAAELPEEENAEPASEADGDAAPTEE